MPLRILVVVPTHDRLQFLDECLDSLAKQTRQADEIVVVGNVMVPGHENVKWVNTEQTLSTKINNVIEASDCDAYILLCDDDMILPRYIELTAAKMEAENLDIVHTGTVCAPVTALFRKRIWAKVGGYAEIGLFDWDYNWSCLEAGATHGFIRGEHFVYREHPEQVARHAQWKADGSWAAWAAAIHAKHPKGGRP